MKRELKENLWNEYLKQSNIPELQKKNLKPLGELFFDDVSFLYEIYPLVGKDNVSSSDKKTNVILENEGTLYILRKERAGIFLKENEMKCLLSDMITLFEDILPLGSVVDLKKDKLFEGMNVSKVENFRVVITKRFLGARAGCFYPYGAGVYPFGVVGGKMISFTPALIERVIYTGYSDETDEELVFQMKHRLIVEQKRKSVGFATHKELKETEETAALDGMNSNFVDKLKRVLEISGDKNLGKLNENIKHYIAEAQTIYEEIKKRMKLWRERKSEGKVS